MVNSIINNQIHHKPNAQIQTFSHHIKPNLETDTLKAAKIKY